MKQLFLFFILLTTCMKADVVTITADEWCPYNCNKEDVNKGFLVDIFTHIFKKAGHEVEYSISSSYEKAIKDVRKNKIDALIGTYQEEVPDFVFPKSAIAYSYDIMLINEDSTWTYQSEDSLNELCIGVVKDYEYEEPIKSHISKYKNNSNKIHMISGNNSLDYNLKKLRYHKITALVDDQLLIQYYQAKTKKAFHFKVAKRFDDYPLYIAFSPNNYKSKEYATVLNRGLRKLKGSPELAKILAKYGLIEKDILQPQ